MIGKDENLAFELLDDHNQLVVPQIEAHEGKILKFIGDAVLASFDSAVQASVCALSIQEAFYGRNKHRNLKEKIWIRIGIHGLSGSEKHTASSQWLSDFDSFQW